MSEPRLPDLTRSFERHLRAENKADRTIETDLEAVRLLQAYLAAAAWATIESGLAGGVAKPRPASRRRRPPGDAA